MKRRILSIFLCVVLIFTSQSINLPTFAASDEEINLDNAVVEGSAAIDILINAGTSSKVLAGDLKEKLEAKLKEKLEDKAQEPGYEDLKDINVRINTPLIDLDTSDLSDWYVYDHYDNQYYNSASTGTSANGIVNDSTAEGEWLKDTENKNANTKGLRPWFGIDAGFTKVASTSMPKITELPNSLIYKNNNIPTMKISDWVDRKYYNQYTQTETKARNDGRPHNNATIHQTAKDAGVTEYVDSLGIFDKHIYNHSVDGVAYIDFVGYYTGLYTDFVYYPCVSQEIKQVAFDIDSSNINAHSLSGAGFFINTGIDSAGKISGYFLYYRYTEGGSITATADGVEFIPISLSLYKLNPNTSADTIHNAVAKNTNNATIVDTFADSILGSSTKIGDSVNIKGNVDVAWDTEMSVRMTISPTTLLVEQKPKSADENEWNTLIDIDGTVGNTLDKTDYNGFGPLVQYQENGHACVRASQFTYSNIKMAYIDQTDKIFDLLSSANYIQNADLYFIDLTDDGENRALEKDGNNAAAYMQAKKIRYITNNPEDELLLSEDDPTGEENTPPLGTNGLKIVTGDYESEGIVNIEALAQKIANYIISQYGGKEPVYDDPLPLSRPVALLSLVRNVEEVGSTYIDIVKRDFVGNGLDIFGFDSESKPSDNAKIETYEYIITNPDGSTRESITRSKSNEVLFTVTNDKNEWPEGEYKVQLTVTDDSSAPNNISAPVTVTFKVVADTVAPLVPKVNINDGKLSFTTSDIGGYGVVGYELMYTPIGDGFKYGDITYEPKEDEDDNDLKIQLTVTSDFTSGSQTELQEIEDIDITLPIGEYTMKLAVYDMAGNKTIVNIPVIDYIDETLVGIKENTIVDTGVTAGEAGTVAINESWIGKNKSYMTSNGIYDKDEDEIHGENNTNITITIPSRPDAPNVKGINEYSDGEKTYKIKDTNDKMEYKSSMDSDYTPITENEIKLESYNENKPYSVRYKAIKGKQFSGKVKEVIFTEDIISPKVPTAKIENGELSFTIKDIGGYGVYNCELTFEPLGSGFTYGDTTYETPYTFKPEITEAMTKGSIDEEQTISGILLPVGEYTMYLTVYDGAGNKTIVMIPTIDYVEEKLLNIKSDTTVDDSQAQADEKVNIKDSWFGTSLTYGIANDVSDYEDNSYQDTNETQITVSIPARPSAPSSVKGGIAYNGKYKIKGITDAMEFKAADDSDYAEVNETVDEFMPGDISGEGNYLARYKAVPGKQFASEDKSFSFETHSISGKVFDYDKTTLKEGVTVELYVGNTRIGVATTTNSKGEFFFDNVEDGNYNIVVKYEQLGTTIMVSVTGQDTDVEVYLPDGKKSLNLVIEDDHITPQEIVVNKLHELFEVVPNENKGEDIIISASDKDIIDDGGKLEIIFNAKGFEENNEEFALPVSELKNLASDDGRIIGLYIDLTVTKYLWEGIRPAYEYHEADDIKALKHLPALIQTIIPLDGNQDLSNNMDLNVYRCHRDVLGNIISEPIPRGFNNSNEFGEYFEISNNSVILTVRRFSEYAIAYVNTDPGDVTVTINKDGSKWEDAGNITLAISGANQNQESIDNGVQKQGVAGGTYKIFRNNIDTGKTVTVKPNDHKEITINYYTLTLEYDKGFSNVTGDGIYVEGSTIDIKAYLFSNYIFEKWIPDIDGSYGDLDIKDTKIIMPGSALHLTATAKYNNSSNNYVDVGAIVTNQVSNGTIYSPSTYPVVGNKVTITVTPNIGYELEELVIQDNDGNIVEFIDNGDGTYTFVQPKGTITINAKFKEIEIDDTDSKEPEPTIDSEDKEPDIPTVYMKKLMGQNQKFALTLLNTEGATVTCYSTKPRLATVNKKGLVTTNTREGKCEIVVTIEKGKNKIRYIMAVTVKEEVKKNYSFTKDYAVDYSKPTIAAYKLLEKDRNWKIQILNTNETTKISYKSSDKSIATVNKNGKVTTKKLGRVDVIATVEQNGIKNKFYFTIRVTDGKKKSDKSYLRVVK